MPVTSSLPASDIQARIAGLFIYPIKSCAGIALDEALLTETGLDLDRAWMVVDAGGMFVTQRELPRMALIQPTLRSADLVLRAPGMLALHLMIDTVESVTHVQVWDDKVQAYDMGDVAAQWFSDFLAPVRPAGAPPRPYRLVRFDPEQRRLASMKWTAGVEAPNQFADGFPLLVTSTASLEGLNRRLRSQGHPEVGMERFRPNIVLGGLDEHDEDRVAMLHITTADGAVALRPVKPCARCPIPNIDPRTATSDPAVGDTLQTYRVDPRVNGGVTFGMNAITIEGTDQTLRIGQPVAGNFRFD
ncbi:MAG TPA: MOSC N-terminal beta barrel domain-containing protein [Burkholderiaceae bacterium]|nr:MOSC N-terminal beta barrel domain-containing protein [Burkholderiaceae bacterium]